MKKNFFTALGILLGLIFLLAGCATSQTADSAAVPTPGTDTPQPSSFLWKLESGNAVLYFYGSIHMATADLYPLPEPIYSAYSACDNLVVELNASDEQNILATQQQIMSKGLFTDGSTLADYINPATTDTLVAIAEEYGIPLEMAQLYKPWLVELTVSVLSLQKLGFDPNLGIDLHFIQRATAEGKPILELETATQQIGFLSDSPLELQVLSLESTLEELEMIPEIMEKMMTAWRSGDTASFDELASSELKESPEYLPIYERLITNRNRAWVGQYEEWIQNGGSYFIITGAGHLTGQDNVIELLRARGYNPVQQ